jgi:hypothetical protein
MPQCMLCPPSTTIKMNYLNEVRDTSTEQRHSADHSVLQMFVEICESFLYMNILAFKIKVCHDYRKKKEYKQQMLVKMQQS